MTDERCMKMLKDFSLSFMCRICVMGAFLGVLAFAFGGFESHRRLSAY